MDWYRWDGEDVILFVRLVPRARANEVVGVEQGALRIRLQAPPVEGKANVALCRFLAERFGVPKSRVELEQGARGRSKRLRVVRPACPPETLLPGP